MFQRLGMMSVLILILLGFMVTNVARHAQASSNKRQELTVEDRVAAQRAIEAVYHRHRIWPTDNPQPKPALNEVLPEAALRAKVADYLRMSRALELFAGAPLAPEQLQQELERMARQTRMPALLGELWAALAHDPLLAAECLARPVVAERELRRWFEERGSKNAERGVDNASALREPQASSLHPRSFDEWWSVERGALGVEVDAPGWAYRLPEIAEAAVPCGSEAWTATSTTGAPIMRNSQTAVWTGSEMIVWGGINSTSTLDSGGRYNPATDTWIATSTTDAPRARNIHTAVWTGREMIIWGGYVSNSVGSINTGGRYNPMTNAWTATTTTGAPTARHDHTAVWTGSEMIIWGGNDFFSNIKFNTGGRYNPTTNAWIATNTAGVPAARQYHTAIWTGSEMIVWGGDDGSYLNTGGRYNPGTNTWIATSTTGAPSERSFHTVVWTGSEMVVWGGGVSFSSLNTGGRYDPGTDVWIATSTTGSPSPRSFHTSVWTGSEMIVWGGVAGLTRLNTGGRYTFTVTSGSLASVSAASFLGAELAAESIVAAFGQNLATATQQASTIPLPTVLAGTTVEVIDSAGMRRSAPLFFVSSGQVNYLIPSGVAEGPANVTIRSGAGAVSSGMIRIARVVPGLFSANSDGQGVPAAQIFRRKADGSEGFEPVARFDAAQQRFIPLPIDLGPETDQVFLILYGTGIRLRSSLSAVTVSVGGVNSEALFADAAPGFVGLDQVNSRLPRSLIGRGEVNVILTVEGKTANTIKLALK